METRTCRCGASKMNFKFDIGPFYIGECCELAGYDALGRPTAQQTIEFKVAPEALTPVTPEEIQGAAKPDVKPRIPGRGKMLDMRIAELVELARTWGVAIEDSDTKDKLIRKMIVVRDGLAK